MKSASYRAVTAAALMLLSACASAGGTSPLESVRNAVSGHAPAAPATPPETFAYAAARDRDVEVTVGRVVFPGERDFIPQDRNWLQVQVTIANAGNRTITISAVKERLTDGTVVASAQSPTELMKQPSFLKSGLATVGVGTAGMLVGAFLFPPAALISGAAIAFAPMFQADRMQRTLTAAQQQGLKTEAVAPGTSAAGYVFLPAVQGQTGLIVFYEAGGETRTIEVKRTGR